MNTAIKKAEKISSGNSVIHLVKNAADLKSCGFSASEINYIKTRNKGDDKNLFAFNRLKKWDYVRFIKSGEDAVSTEAERKAGNDILSKINGDKLSEILISDKQDNAAGALAFIEGMALGNYQFNKYKKKKNGGKSFNTLKGISVVSKNISAVQLEELNIITESVYLARDLVNEPVSYLDATRLAAEAEKLCVKQGAKVEIMNRKKIETLKMGGLLSVNKGSPDPPTFTVIEWKPAKHRNKKPYVFVGKGVVYDTGGICLKPTSGMETMKDDMSGAAAVIGVMHAIAKARLPVYAIGLIPATDNRPDGNSQVPGDIITMFDGTTVEVLNTDAEGRLILADALAYAKKYNPELVIDIATLTGAARAAIGKYAMAGMGAGFGNYLEELKKSGENVCERIVEFPLWDDYSELLKSDVADLKNIGGPFAGAITAGKFLQHFTDYPWIHLDIAGTAFMESRDSYRGKGGTGWGIRIMFDFIKKQI